MEIYTLDIKSSGRQFICEGFRAGDNGIRTLCFHLTLGASSFFPPENCIATLFARLPDGGCIYDSCEILGDSVIYTLKGSDGTTPAVTALSGLVECEICIVSEDGRTVTCPRFALLVEPTVRDDTAIEAQESFSALTDALGRVIEAENGLSSKMDKVSGTAGNAAVISENGSVSDFGAPPVKCFTFIYDDSGSASPENMATAKAVREAINSNIPFYVLIFDDAGYSHAYVEINSESSLRIISLQCHYSCYYEIVINNNTVRYLTNDTVSDNFSEAEKIPATQAATAAWVKSFVDESITKGEW